MKTLFFNFELVARKWKNEKLKHRTNKLKFMKLKNSKLKNVIHFLFLNFELKT